MNGNAQEADQYFRTTLGLGYQDLLAAISGGNPEGIPAAEDESYRRIRHEREEEDASLPLGAWERKLKRANWDAASELAARALATKSKDLQLAAWLFESLIARTGFQALAPCLELIDALFVQYGERLHPQDNDHRVNLMSWIGQKLLPPLRRVAITATGTEHDFSWNDWEQAQRNEQLRAALGKQREAEIEGALLNDVNAALACTPDARIVFLQGCLVDGIAASHALEITLDAQLGEDAPSLSAMRTLLERIEAVLMAEARRRGFTASVHSEEPEQGDTNPDFRHMEEHATGSLDRREVYAALAEIAHVLERIEPHSPVPYLIRRAVAWGGLNTAQLYHEVFVRCGGQINIFELLGLADPTAEDTHEVTG